jgi:lipid-A-disaccharide synthase
MVKKFFLIAGEQSGDLLGSKLIRELKSQLEDQKQPYELIGVGGKLMKQEGLTSIFPMEELCVMGFSEVLPHIPRLLRRIKQTAALITKEKPDYIITIDAPDFCFRVMKRLNDCATRLGKCNVIPGKRIHLIAPSVWAYRAGRAKKISKLYDLLLTILPFEPPFFEKHGLKTVFIGHPLMDKAIDFSQKKCINEEFREKFKLEKNDILLCMTPGSRTSEVKRMFPQFIAAANLLRKKNPKLKVLIPLVDKTASLVRNMAHQHLDVPHFLIEETDKNSAFFASDFALAKSGTNAVEFSLYHVPTIVAYRASFLTFHLFKLMTKAKFANLINLVANEEIIPEMLQYKCESNQLAAKLEQLMNDKEFAQKQIEKTEAALKLMGIGSKESPSSKAAKTILSL